MHYYLKLLFTILISILSINAYADCDEDRINEQWCYPTGTENIGDYRKWHAGAGGEFVGKHLAIDIEANQGDKVYAIADGVIVANKLDASFYGGIQDSNGDGKCKESINGEGMVVRHTSPNGKKFDALYAHIQNATSGSKVRKGEVIAEIGKYIACGNRIDHLHFGIIYPEGGSPNQWAGYGSTDMGFVDPLPFLEYNRFSVIPNCAPYESGVLCWWSSASLKPKPSYPSFAFCEDGYKHTYYPNRDLRKKDRISIFDIRAYCDKADGDADLQVFLSSGIIVPSALGGGGPGEYQSPTDSPKKKNCVNFITTETRLYDRTTGDEQYEFEPGETIRGRAWYQNVGSCDLSGDPEKIPSLVLLSKGYKEDSHSKWKPVDEDTTKHNHLDAGDDPHEEKYSFSAPLREGVYNAVFCIDRDKPKGNGDGEVKEIHKSDNCSTETVFTVKSPAEPDPEPPFSLVWSPNGTIDGMVCTQITESRESIDHGWDNNYLCADKDYGIVWSEFDQVIGMSCAHITEPSDPHGWDNNYLCIPEQVDGFDEFSFSWSSEGAIVGKTCLQWTEPLEPNGHGWQDNFMCYTAIETPPPPACVKPDLNSGQVDNPSSAYDFVIDRVGSNKLILSPGEEFNPEAIACFNGDDTTDTRIGYYISPCDGSSSTYIDDDGVDEDNYDIGGCSAERINTGTNAPSAPGKYILTVCADYQQSVSENIESNNCNWLEIEVR